MKKNRSLLLICVLFFAAALAGCGKSSPAVSVKVSPGEALYAYRGILEDAPALEGEHEELADASFDYEQNLKKFGNHFDRFAIYDLNQDGVPELIAQTVVNFRWTPVFIYTYSDGNAILLKDPSGAPGSASIEQNSSANGAYTLFFCEENHIHSVWRGTDPAGEAAEENSAYALEGTTLVATDCSVGESENTVYFSDIAMANTAENVDAITR